MDWTQSAEAWVMMLIDRYDLTNDLFDRLVSVCEDKASSVGIVTLAIVTHISDLWNLRNEERKNHGNDW